MKTKKQVEDYFKDKLCYSDDMHGIKGFLSAFGYDNVMVKTYVRGYSNDKDVNCGLGAFKHWFESEKDEKPKEKEPTKIGSLELGVDVKKCDECEYKKKAEKDIDGLKYFNHNGRVTTNFSDMLAGKAVLGICFDNGKKPSIFSEKLNIGSKKWWEEKDNAPKPKFKVGESVRTKAYEKIKLCGLYITVIKADSVVKILQIEDVTLMQNGVESKTFQYLVKNGDSYGRYNEKDLESAENESDIPKPKFKVHDKLRVKEDMLAVQGYAMVLFKKAEVIEVTKCDCFNDRWYVEVRTPRGSVTMDEKFCEKYFDLVEVLKGDFHRNYADSILESMINLKNCFDKLKGNSYKYRNEERRELKEQLEVFKELRDRKKSGQVYKLACEDIARIEKMLEERI